MAESSIEQALNSALSSGLISPEDASELLSSHIARSLPPVDDAFGAGAMMGGAAEDIGSTELPLLERMVGQGTAAVEGAVQGAGDLYNFATNVPSAIGSLYDNPALSGEEVEQLKASLPRALGAGLGAMVPGGMLVKGVGEILGGMAGGEVNRQLGTEAPLQEGDLAREFGGGAAGLALGAIPAGVAHRGANQATGLIENSQITKQASTLGRGDVQAGAKRGLIQNLGVPANDTATNTARALRASKAIDTLTDINFFDGTQFDPVTMKFIRDGSAGADAASSLERATNLVDDLAPVVRTSNKKLSQAIDSYNRLTAGNPEAPRVGSWFTYEGLMNPEGDSPAARSLINLDQKIADLDSLYRSGAVEDTSDIAIELHQKAQNARRIKKEVIGSVFDEGDQVSLENVSRAKRILNSIAAEAGFFDLTTIAKAQANPSAYARLGVMDVVYDDLYKSLSRIEDQLVDEAFTHIPLAAPELLLDDAGMPLNVQQIKEVNRIYGAAKDASIDFAMADARDLSSSAVRGNTNIMANPASRSDSTILTGGTMGKMGRAVGELGAKAQGLDPMLEQRIADADFRSVNLGRQNKKLATLARGDGLTQPIPVGKAILGNSVAIGMGVEEPLPPLPPTLPASTEALDAYMPQLMEFARRRPNSPVAGFVGSYASAMTPEEKRERLASFMMQGVIPREPDPDGYLTVDGVLVNSEFDPLVQQAYARGMTQSVAVARGIADVPKRMKVLLDLYNEKIPVRQRRYTKKKVTAGDAALPSTVTPTAPTTGYMKPEPVNASEPEEKSAIDTVSDNLED